jgi:carboxypeptidase Q
MLRRTAVSFLCLSSLVFAQAPAEAAPTALLPDGMAERIRDEGIAQSQAMRLLRDLCGKVGHRLTGSDNFTKACYWAAGEFQAMGMPVVTLERWGEWRLAWNRGVWTGRITNPVAMELYIATEAWTAGTNGAVTGLIVAVPTEVADVTPKKVANKWVYYSKRPSREIRDACEAVGILGWVHRAGDPDAKFPLRVRVFGDHRTAMKPIENAPVLPVISVRADQADALAELLATGKDVTAEFQVENTFRDGGIPLYNVIAEIPGSEKPEEVVIVCGHLDSWHQAQGTTDNGTGATSTLEAARILMAAGAKPKRTIRFCLWGGEEQGLLGSHGYVQRHRTEMERVSAVFNHDTGTNWAQSLGAPAKMFRQLEPVFAPVSALLSAPDRAWEGPVFQLKQTEELRGGGGSDHASFIAAGVPGLNWSLTGRSNYFSHTWHTQWDTIAVAVPEYQRHTATVIALAALGTANLDAMLDRTGVVSGGGGRPQSTSYAEAMFDAEMEGLAFTVLKPEGRAAKIGLLKGDVLQKVNGEEIESLRDIFRVSRASEGDELTFAVKRGDTVHEVKMKKADLRR